VIRSTGTRAHINHLAEIDLVVEGGYLVAGGERRRGGGRQDDDDDDGLLLPLILLLPPPPLNLLSFHLYSQTPYPPQEHFQRLSHQSE